MLRTDAEFRAHPQGQATLAEPLVAIEKIADSEPEPFGPAAWPLTGLRVLQDTKVIAGTVVGRTLAEHRADVLHVNGPNEFEQDVNWNEVGIGMRSAAWTSRKPKVPPECASCSAAPTYSWKTAAGRAVLWTTTYLGDALDALRADRYPITDEAAAHLTPAHHDHINFYGTYSFDVETELHREGRRPLRSPAA